MGKYAKIALVLLYAAQLGVAFRDQLVHLYRQAVDMVHRDAAFEQAFLTTEPTVLKRALQPGLGATETISAASLPPFALAHEVGDGHEEDATHVHDHDSDDHNKDKAKKQRLPRIREIVYADLFQLTRHCPLPPSSVEPRVVAQLLALAFPYTAQAAA